MVDISNSPIPLINQDTGLSVFTHPINPSDVIPTATVEMTSIANFEYLDDRPKYYMKLGIGTYTRNASGATALRLGTDIDTPDQIILPLPTTLVDRHSVSYSQTALGSFGALVDAGLTAMNVDGSYKSAAQTAAGSGISGFIGMADRIGRAPGSGALNQIIGGGLGGAAGTLGILGYAPNQFETILLRGPQYKTFDFTWHLSPKTTSESNKLNLILNLLKNASAVGLTGSDLFWSFPKIFLISLFPNVQYLFKFKPCVLTHLTVDYAGGGAPSFHRSLDANYGDNAPTEFIVQMKFKELEYWLTGQYNSSDNPQDPAAREVVSQTGFIEGIGQVATKIGNALNNALGGALDAGAQNQNTDINNVPTGTTPESPQ